MSGADLSMVLDALQELSDADLQRELWSGTGPLVSSLQEAQARLFDDSGLGHALDRGGTGLPAVVDERLRELGRLLARVDSAVPVEDLLRDDGLAQVRRLAADLLLRLQARGGPRPAGVSSEKQRLLDAAVLAPSTPLGLLREIHAVGTTAVVSAARERIREVMLVVVDNERLGPNVDRWRSLLPSWFVEACGQEETPAESNAWLRRWRALPLKRRAQLEAGTAWSLADWCWWLGDSRPWSSWDLDAAEGRLRWRLLVQEDQAPVAAAEWLVRACGLQVEAVV